jgi:KDO2-lipid IV(A) lauroyltransferase
LIIAFCHYTRLPSACDIWLLLAYTRYNLSINPSTYAVFEGSHMGSNVRPQRNYGEYIAYSLARLLIVLGRLPRPWVYGALRYLSLVFYKLGRRRREVATANLQYAFGLEDLAETDRLARSVYVSLSETLADIFLMLNNRLDIDESVVNKTEALAKLERLKGAFSGSWIFVTAHFSNWELMAQFLAKHGYAMLVVGREGDNRLIDHRLTLPFRQRFGNDTTYKKGAATAIFKRLKRGGRVGLLIDQKTEPSEGVKVDFFGRSVYATGVVATMREKLDAAVIPVFIPRVGRGQYRLEIGDPVTLQGDVTAMTQAYSDAMEAVIRRYPEQWFWMHNRWGQRDED